ncbi:MAG: NUDIX domain-containing protein [Planctomycetota bacterium]
MSDASSDIVTPRLPYKIAVLCYLFDEQGRVLLLHRVKPPNQHLYSPIGGKLEQAIGESPTQCAVREIHEEAGLEAAPADLHLTGIVSETAFQGQTHWLMFLYELTRSVQVRPEAMIFDEGRLEWHDPGALAGLPIPETDQKVIWPLFWEHRGGFFTVHIDCTGPELSWRIEQSAPTNGSYSDSGR